MNNDDQPAHVVCNRCSHSDTPDNFDACLSSYHDMRCPKCGGTNIDTSKMAAEWKAAGREYGYGDNNTLILP